MAEEPDGVEEILHRVGRNSIMTYTQFVQMLSQHAERLAAMRERTARFSAGVSVEESPRVLPAESQRRQGRDSQLATEATELIHESKALPGAHADVPADLEDRTSKLGKHLQAEEQRDDDFDRIVGEARQSGNIGPEFDELVNELYGRQLAELEEAADDRQRGRTQDNDAAAAIASDAPDAEVESIRARADAAWDSAAERDARANEYQAAAGDVESAAAAQLADEGFGTDPKDSPASGRRRKAPSRRASRQAARQRDRGRNLDR